MTPLKIAVAGAVAICGLILTSFSVGAEDAIPACNLIEGVGTPLVLVESRAISLPGAGVETTAEVGQSMLLTGNLNVYSMGLILNTRVVADDGKGLTVDIPNGVLTFSAAGGGYRYYVSAQAKATKDGEPRFNIMIGIGVPDVSGLPWKIFISGGERYEFETSKERIDAVARYCSTTDAKGLQRELVYSGGSNGTISLLYREYSGDLARPAFTQQLTYDLTAGKEIGFRGARIKILGATNLGVKYVVERGFEGAPSS